MKTKKHGGLAFFILGGVMFSLAFLLVVYNVCQENNAEVSSQMVLEELREVREDGGAAVTPAVSEDEAALAEPVEQSVPQYLLVPETPMPTVNINGYDYIGTLTIPALGLELPIMSNWSYPGLRVAPCRYYGSVYMHNIIIAAHNYAYHFGLLNTLSVGDEVIFTDMDENVFRYEIIGFEVLGRDARDEMLAGEWDMTLFTCTYGGKTRFTVRCRMAE